MTGRSSSTSSISSIASFEADVLEERVVDDRVDGVRVAAAGVFSGLRAGDRGAAPTPLFIKDGDNALRTAGGFGSSISS